MNMKLLVSMFGLAISASVFAQASVDPSLTKTLSESKAGTGNAQTAGTVKPQVIVNNLVAPESKDSAKLHSDRSMAPVAHMKKPAKHVKKASSVKRTHKHAKSKANTHKHNKKKSKRIKPSR